jgi:BirA family biotin operon repressor/biotin-[acetyl-CoA-carboxylase] ligase
LIPSKDVKNFAGVLRYLLDSKGHHSVDQIAHGTGLKRTDVTSALSHFAESGLKLDEKDKTYAIGTLPDSINPAVLFCGLGTHVMGHTIHSYKSIGSTNQAAKHLAESGAVEGTMVIADRQTRGRGRLGRSWHSPGEAGLYFSLVLRPWVSINRMPALSQVAAMSVCRAIEKVCDCQARVKWPNDCLLNGRKVAGILVELSAELDKIDYAILGIGINVNNQRRELPSPIRSHATSLAIESGGQHNRVNLLHRFLADFEKSYSNFQKYGLRFIGPELVRRSSVLGQRVNINLGKTRVSGIATGIDENGALRLKIKDHVKTISAGEVSLR